MLRIIISFFAGVLVTLYLLIPGKIELGDFLDTEKRCQIADFNRAGEKIDEMGDLALFYTFKAKEYVHNKVVDHD